MKADESFAKAELQFARRIQEIADPDCLRRVSEVASQAARQMGEANQNVVGADYVATKKSNELMAHAYSKLYNIPSTGLRFFTVYGSAGRPDMAYFGFTNKLLKAIPSKFSTTATASATLPMWMTLSSALST